MIKKILYISFEYEFGNPNNGYAINYKAWYENFVKLGYQVEPIFYDRYSKDELQIKIIDQATKIKPDLIFFILQKSHVEKKTLKILQDLNFFVVNFFGDDQWRFDNYSKMFANYFNACITTDKFSVEKYRDIGQHNVIRSQWGSLESAVEYENICYQYDVSFVGGKNPFRKWFINELEKRSIKVNCFGDGWKNGRVTYSQMEKIFATSKINLNISNSVQYDVRYLLSNPRNIINTLKSAKNVSQTKARIFEIPVQGGFELTEYVPSLEDYFDIGRHIVCYKDIDEAELLINYYLKHEDERETIKVDGIKRARDSHTFKQRIIEFMKEIESVYNQTK